MGARRRAAPPPLSARGSRGRARKTRRRRPTLRIGDPARAASGAVAVLCAAALAWIAFGEGPVIEVVHVSGARHVRSAQAVAQSGLVDARAFLASAAQARDRLRTLPAVRDARVEIALPATARIRLVEREAIGRWVTANGLEWFVDAEGVPFPSADASAAPGLRAFDERPAATSPQRLDPALVRVAMRLAAIAPGEMRADATAPRVVMTAGASGLVLRFGTGWEIRFGGPDSFEEKLALAKRYLRDNPQRRLDYVDVRSADRIVVSPQ